MSIPWLLATFMILTPVWSACGAPPAGTAEAAQPPEPDEPTPANTPDPVDTPEPGEPIEPPVLDAPTEEPDPPLPTPDPRAPCCFTHPRYAGTCLVTPAEDETCASILAYLNDQQSAGKTYCQSTDLRGGWQPVQCVEP